MFTYIYIHTHLYIYIYELVSFKERLLINSLEKMKEELVLLIF